MNSPPLSLTNPLSSRTLLALTEAMEHAFDASAWARLGAELEMPQLADPELRLQQSLRFGDDDYGYCVAQFVRHLEAERPADLRDLANRSEIKAWLDSNAPGAAQELGLGLDQRHATAPVESAPASTAVEHALMDAHHVLDSSEPVNCIHPSHDALHGYLFDVASQANLTVARDATVAELYWSLINGHPAFAAQTQPSPQVVHVLASLAAAVTALSTVRGDATTVDANQTTPEGPEAVLMADLVRTVFNYVRRRLEAVG
ncbi:hypothetical protein ACFFGH_17240 [Lysobacter korlensis]|uniref:AbiJ N-terminal domain-containing protein n=1 Tax=Lysobacter korlensis TaxID=553636 RepID=A0ABV6RSM5_9GAMM